MKNYRRGLIIAIGCWLVWLICAAQSVAQQPPGPQGRPGPPFRRGGSQGPGFPEPDFRFISSEMRFGGKVVKGAPYSAEAITESTQTLSDGTKLSWRATALVYRDSEGRTRREQSSTTAGPFATETPRMIFISDPVAGLSYTLFPDSMLARKLPLPSLEAKREPPRGPYHNHPWLGELKTEPLGKQMIEGIEAEGTRTVMTIPENKIGNDRPIEIVHERWYSPELQTIVLSKHRDPRWGETVFRLTRINRSEPDRSLFELPSGYTVKEERLDRRSRSRGPKRVSER